MDGLTDEPILLKLNKFALVPLAKASLTQTYFADLVNS